MFLLDSSKYVEQRNFEIIKLFTKKVVANMDLEKDGSRSVRIGVAAFSDGVEEEIHLNEHRNRLVSAFLTMYTWSFHPYYLDSMQMNRHNIQRTCMV